MQSPGLLQNMPDIDALFTRHTAAEVGAILDSMLSGDSSAEARSRETTQYSTNKKSSVDKAFDELMAG